MADIAIVIINLEETRGMCDSNGSWLFWVWVLRFSAKVSWNERKVAMSLWRLGGDLRDIPLLERSSDIK